MSLDLKTQKHKTSAMIDDDLKEVHLRLLLAQLFALVFIFTGFFCMVVGVLTMFKGWSLLQ